MGYAHATLAQQRAAIETDHGDLPGLVIDPERNMADLCWRDDDGTFHGPDHVALRAVPLEPRGRGRVDQISQARQDRDDALRRSVAEHVEAYARALLRRHGIGALIGALLLAAPAAHADGLYVNAFAGPLTFDTTTTVGGIKLIDQGGDALAAGARIGYGRRFASGIYLGAEAEGALASGRSRVVIPAANSSTGQTETYSRGVNSWVGGFARLGIAPGPVTLSAPPSLFFVRAGVQGFNTTQGTDWVPAIGAGAEIRLTQHLAARIDVTYAWSDVETYQGTIGLSWRF